MPEGAPTIFLASSPRGNTKSCAPNRLYLLLSCATTGLKPVSLPSAAWFVVQKQPVTAHASRLTS